MSANDHSTEGFDAIPDRHPAVTFLLFVGVVFASGAIAVGFKESALWTVQLYGNLRDPTRVAADLYRPLTLSIVAAATLCATTIGRFVARRWPQQSGLESIAACARGEDRRISLRATLLRGVSTWLCVVGLVPIGRESAIMETGGAIGSTVGRRFGGRGAAMAAGGLSAAFAAAYHAPIAAVFYLEEHLRIRGSRRAATFAVGGAIGGHLLATRLLGATAILPRVTGSWDQLAVAGTIAVLPATVGARLLLELRTVVARSAPRSDQRAVWWLNAVVGALVAGSVVAIYPLAAGNGMDALRHSAALGVVGVGFALALGLGKAVGVSSAFRAGVPGGAMTPSMTVAAGSSLCVVLVFHALGGGEVYVWGVVVLSAAVGVGVGLRSPLTAIVMLPEMAGQRSLIPATALIVGVATLVDRRIDDGVRRLGNRLPTAIRDEDG